MCIVNRETIEVLIIINDCKLYAGGTAL